MGSGHLPFFASHVSGGLGKSRAEPFDLGGGGQVTGRTLKNLRFSRVASLAKCYEAQLLKQAWHLCFITLGSALYAHYTKNSKYQQLIISETCNLLAFSSQCVIIKTQAAATGAAYIHGGVI